MKEKYKPILELADELKSVVSRPEDSRAEKANEAEIIGICEAILNQIGVRFTLATEIPGRKPKNGKVKNLYAIKRGIKDFLSELDYEVIDVVKLPEFAPDNGDAVCVHLAVEEEMDYMVQRTLEAQLLENFPQANLIVITPFVVEDDEEEEFDDD